MTNYNIRYKDESLAHAGKKGMKWGFNDGQKNGKRTADTALDDLSPLERAKRRERYNDEILVKNVLARQEAKKAIARAKRRTKIENAINFIPRTINKETKKVQKNVKKKAMKVARRIDKFVHPDDELIKYNRNPVTGNYVIKSRTKVKNKNRWFK